MIFLILKIFVYLVIALVMGGAAGFLLRHLQAQKETEETTRQLQDAKSKVPQLESLLRARDERIRQLSKNHSEQSEAAKGSRMQDEQHARALREKDMELQRLRARLQSVEQNKSDGLIDGELLAAGPVAAAATQPDPTSETDDVLIAELHLEVDRLKEELSSAAIRLEVAQNDGTLEQELEELRVRLRQKAEDYERLQQQLDHEQRKVSELERERELQNKSLKVLHQQLEMARGAQS